jgi:hypothetical protein
MIETGFRYKDRIIEASKIDLKKYGSEKWYLTIWRITNVLPFEN